MRFILSSHTFKGELTKNNMISIACRIKLDKWGNSCVQFNDEFTHTFKLLILMLNNKLGAVVKYIANLKNTSMSFIYVKFNLNMWE